jgi:hypothetical protein
VIDTTAAAMIARSAGSFAFGAQKTAAINLGGDEPAFIWQFQGHLATFSSCNDPEPQVEDWGKERPTEHLYKTSAQLDLIRS